MGEPLPQGLVVDVGGTNARVGLWDGAGLSDLVALRCSDYPSLAALLYDYRARILRRPLPQRGAVAVACPVLGDNVELTNSSWSFSIEALRAEAGLKELAVVNDFEALAWSLLVLGPKQLQAIREGTADLDAPRALLGPGTGLGVGGLVGDGRTWTPLSGEGGHRDLAATSRREWQIVEALQERYGHVSGERVLSGPGLLNLHTAISALYGEKTTLEEPHEVAEAAAQGQPAARETLQQFASWLGAIAGDLTLTLGARGGVYLGGGILPKLGAAFDRSQFLQRYLEKGRFRSYLEPVPVWLIVEPYATLHGLGRMLDQAAPAPCRS